MIARKQRFLAALLLASVAVLSTAVASVTYQYDHLHRLVQAAYPNGQTITYTYDAVGNRTRIESVRVVDINGDGVLDAADVIVFVNVVLGIDLNPGHVLASDIDHSGTVDGKDIQPFVAAVLGS